MSGAGTGRRRWQHAFATLREYLGSGGLGRTGVIDGAGALAQFIDSRSAHVAQTALYGYLKARSGTRYPELFEHDAFLVSINIAKWQVWLACISDLCVFSGGLLARRVSGSSTEVGALMLRMVEDLLDGAGVPADAGDDYVVSSNRVRERVRVCDWPEVADDASVFTESPRALVHWAPVADGLKRFDVEIVENSVRYRWVEVRRDLRRLLDAHAVLGRQG